MHHYSLQHTAQVDETEVARQEQQWVQTKGPEGGSVLGLFTTSRGDVFAGTKTGLYRLNDDGTGWNLINSINGPRQFALDEKTKWWEVVEHQDTLYFTKNAKVLASTDRGETWKEVCDCPKGNPVGMVMTDGFLEVHPNMTTYLAFTFGVYRSNDVGKTWKKLSEGLKGRKISAIVAIDNTIFAGTNKGLYQLNSDTWEKLAIGPEKNSDKTYNISELIATKNHLYVAAKTSGGNLFDGKHKVFVEGLPITEIVKPNKELPSRIEVKNADGQGITWTLFHSTDRGKSWKSITPKLSKDWKKYFHPWNGILVFGATRRVFASGEKVMVIEGEDHHYSVDAGDNWTTLDNTDDIGDVSSVLLMNATTIYRSGTFGIHRTTNKRESWRQFNTGLVNTNVQQIYSINGILYANTESGLVNSNDDGESWIPVIGDSGFLTHIFEFNEELYVRDSASGTPRFLKLSSKKNNLKSISELPVLKYVPSTISTESSHDRFEIVEIGNRYHMKSFLGSFAITDTTYYVEFQNKLFRWNFGDINWYDTGITDFDEATRKVINSKFIYPTHFRFGVSGKTVYVGKQGGQLMQSSDEGNRWNDVTEHLPFAVEYFNAIVFTGQTVYVATNKGVVRSSNGTDWHTLTDAEGTPLVVNLLAVDGTTVYGTAKRKVYQITENTNTWQQVTPEIPHSVSCIDVDGHTLYVGTSGRGVLRYTLDE